MAIIYKILSKTSKKVYIGKTKKDLENRFLNHIYTAKAGSKHHFHRAIQKYGKEDFCISILESFENDISDQILNEREIY
jgi:group I intron endonuclease